MIAHSRLVFASVLGVSFGLHLGAITLAMDEPQAQMEGGAQGTESSLGSSFTDLAAGIQRPVETVEALVPLPVADAEISLNTPSVKATSSASVTAKAVKHTTLVPSQTTSVDQAHKPIVAEMPAAPSQTARKPVSPLAVTQSVSGPSETKHAENSPMPLARLVPSVSAKSETESVVPATVLAALPDTTGATPISARPKLPVTRPAAPRPAPERTTVDAAPKSATAKPAPRSGKPVGNAKQNAKTGTQTGKASKPAQPRRASKASTNKAQGNAAASNYPGQVMRRISRVSRPRTSARGEAVIQFSIAANGGLASASVARSSGSAALDRAALAVVKKAQPFPRPPSGARRSYSIKIKGR